MISLEAENTLDYWCHWTRVCRFAISNKIRGRKFQVFDLTLIEKVEP